MYIGVDPSTDGRYYAVGLGALGGVLRGLPTSSGIRTMAFLPEVRAELGGAGPCQLAVETPVYSYRAGAVARAVLACAVVAGALHGAGVASGSFTKVVAVAPEEWRKWLCGKRNPSNGEIKAALTKHVELPRCNEHVRDALGVALWLRAVGRSALLPWLHWESGSGWSSATSGTAGSTHNPRPRPSGSVKPRRNS